MASFDIFNDDAFGAVQLTAAIEKVPYVPSFLGSLNIFQPVPVRTETVAIEKRNGKLSIIQTSERGAAPQQRENEKRDIRDFRTVRLAHGDTLYAHELQNIRAFGSDTELMQVQAEVARRMASIRQNFELTWESHRLGAIQGIVLDADGSVIINWFNAWGINQPAEVDFELDDAATDVRGKCQAIVRAMVRAGKGAFLPSTQIHALAGDDFYDMLTNHKTVRETYLNWTSAAELRGSNAFQAFPYGGIMFHNYRGTDDNSTVAVDAAKCKFFPVGAPGVFQTAYSPAETFDFVNTPGQELYAMTIPDRDRNAWVELEAYSYPLHICTRPEMLLRAKKQ